MTHLLTELQNMDTRNFLSICNENFGTVGPKNKYVHLCNDDNTWKLKYIKDYGNTAASYKSPQRTWKVYYLKTVIYDDEYGYVDSLARTKAEERGDLDIAKVFRNREEISEIQNQEYIKLQEKKKSGNIPSVLPQPVHVTDLPYTDVPSYLDATSPYQNPPTIRPRYTDRYRSQSIMTDYLEHDEF